MKTLEEKSAFLQQMRFETYPGPEIQIVSNSPAWLEVRGISDDNEFYIAIHQAQLAEETAPSKISETIERANHQGHPLYWYVMNPSTPSNLATLLEKAGLHRRFDGYGMLVNPKQISLQAVTVVQIKLVTPDIFDEFVEIAPLPWEFADNSKRV
jgi:hypothetical protein